MFDIIKAKYLSDHLYSYFTVHLKEDAVFNRGELHQLMYKGEVKLP